MMKFFLVTALLFGILTCHPLTWAAEATGSSLQDLQHAAEQGDMKAVNKLGEMYNEGDGVQMDEKKAVEFFQQAADAGLAEAQYNLGTCYFYGYGVNRDFSIACQWYSKAAEQKLPIALDELSKCYFTGLGVARDDVKGMALLQEALELNCPHALFTLALCYMDGYGGLPRNYAKAKELLENALAKGVADAKDALLWLQNEDDEATNKLKGEIQEVFEEIDELSIPETLFYRAMQYMTTENSTYADYAEGVKLLLRAAEKGHVFAQVYAGMCYADGLGVASDKEKSIYWFKKAAEQGNCLAKLVISGMGISQDVGLEVDMKQLENELIKLAGSGDRFYQILLGAYYYNEETELDRRRLAIQWFEAAAKQNVAIAQYYLGVCYYKGVIVEKDEKKAIHYWRQAATQGFTNAQLNVLEYFQTKKDQKEVDPAEAEALREKLKKKDVFGPDIEIKSNTLVGWLTMIYKTVMFVMDNIVTGLA